MEFFLPGHSTCISPKQLNVCLSAGSVKSHGTPPRNTFNRRRHKIRYFPPSQCLLFYRLCFIVALIHFNGSVLCHLNNSQTVMVMMRLIISSIYTPVCNPRNGASKTKQAYPHPHPTTPTPTHTHVIHDNLSPEKHIHNIFGDTFKIQNTPSRNK